VFLIVNISAAMIHCRRTKWELVLYQNRKFSWTFRN